MQAADLRDETSGSYRAVVTMTKDEAVQLEDEIRDLHGLGSGSELFYGVPTLDAFHKALCEAHGLPYRPL